LNAFGLNFFVCLFVSFFLSFFLSLFLFLVGPELVEFLSWSNDSELCSDHFLTGFTVQGVSIRMLQWLSDTCSLVMSGNT
jgi:hypothetical protein